MPDVLKMALKAARVGLSVFPVEGGGKRPYMTPRGRLQWGSLATTDEGVIYDWWTHRCSDANYGIACKPSRLLVVDCDTWKEGKTRPEAFSDSGCQTGEDMFASVTEGLRVPFPFDTLTVRTPSQGMHYFFRNAADVPLRNSSLIPGWLDIRANGGAEGGFVVGPGSARSDGAPYEVVTNRPIMPAPDWLISLCSPPPPKPVTARPPGPRYSGPAKYDGLVETLRHQTVNRNDTLNWAAYKMNQDGATIDEAIAILTPAALECGLDDHEVTPTIRSAYKRNG